MPDRVKTTSFPFDPTYGYDQEAMFLDTAAEDRRLRVTQERFFAALNLEKTK